jgi:hypothetical protein
MGLFSRDASPPDPGAAPPAALSERLHEVAAAAIAPEDALEPALRAILEATGAAAGALCLYDQRHDLLRLAEEVGLSDEGCRQLRNVHRGGAGCWDIPLHGLLNRRAYLIDSASRNRYVPPLVEPVASVRTVVCLPLYAGQVPLGSLVLVALTPASISERTIKTLEQPLRELSRMIEAVRGRAGGAGSGTPAPKPPAEPAAAAREARDALSSAQDIIQRLEDDVRRAQEEVARRAAHEEATLTARCELESALDEARTRGAALARELAAMQEELEQAASRHAAELETQRTEEQRLRQAVAELETERDGQAQELAAARARLEEAGARVGELEQAAAEARARSEELERERTVLREEHEATMARHATEHEATEARHAAELKAVQAREEQLRRAVAELEAERDRQKQDLAAARADGAAGADLAGQLAEARTRGAELDRDLAALREEHAAGVTRHAEALEAARVEQERLRSTVATLETVGEERDRAVERLAAVEAERDRLVDALAALEARPEPAPPPATAPAPVEPRAEPGPKIVTLRRPAPVEAPAPPPAEPVQEADGPRPLVILDADPTWTTAAHAGGVTVVAPGEELANRYGELGSATFLVNLTAPGALAAVAWLRAAGSTAPLWGCLSRLGTDRVLPLGRVESIGLPLDPEAVLAALGRHSTKGARVVTAGADVDALMSLRQALTREGMSVSMAWDASQATDLITMVRPKVVIVDLDLPPRAGYGVVAGLAAAEPVPIMVLIAGRGDAASGFGAALTDPANAAKTVPRRGLIEQMQRADAPPPRRAASVSR